MKLSVKHSLQAMEKLIAAQHQQVGDLKADEEDFLSALEADSSKAEATEALVEALEELETLLAAALETLESILE